MNIKFDMLLKGGYLFDPLNNFEGTRDIGIKDGQIITVSEDLSTSDTEAVFDISGFHVMPGIIDMHAHLDDPFGYKMLAMAGVTTVLEMAGPVEQVLQESRDEGTGINVATIEMIHRRVESNDPSPSQIKDVLGEVMKKGSLGLKIFGGDDKALTPEAIARVIQIANDEGVYVASHCGSAKTGSNIEGMLETVELAENNRLHVAHINSYCRGVIRDYMTETREAIESLIAHPNLRCESYLSPMNSSSLLCKDGKVISPVTENCLRLGGYEQTEKALEKAILEGWANVITPSDGRKILINGKEGVAAWRAVNTDIRASFNVNPPEPRYWLATAKRPDGNFVTDAIGTDGGSLPRNVIIEMGLSLVKLQALTMADFIKKTSINPGRILGLNNRGHLGEGAEADITVIDYNKQQAYMTIVGGKPVMHNGIVSGKGGSIITTAAGVDNVKSYGLKPIVTDIPQSAFYKGL